MIYLSHIFSLVTWPHVPISVYNNIMISKIFHMLNGRALKFWCEPTCCGGGGVFQLSVLISKCVNKKSSSEWRCQVRQEQTDLLIYFPKDWIQNFKTVTHLVSVWRQRQIGFWCSAGRGQCLLLVRSLTIWKRDEHLSLSIASTWTG